MVASVGPALIGIVVRMRTVPLLLLVVALGPMAACSDGESSPTTVALAASAPASTNECAPAGSGDASRTVVVRANDLVGGFGSFGTRVSRGLTAGTVRISVEADEENVGPIVVTVSQGGVTTLVISGVEPGTTCGVDVELVTGSYDVTDGTQNAGFEVIAGAG